MAATSRDAEGTATGDAPHAAGAPPRLRIDVWSDVICPWCAIGLAGLDQALDRSPVADRVDVVLRAFLLDPRARSRSPEEHVEAIARKYGTSPEAIHAQHAKMARLGAERGVELRFDRVRSGPTLDAHRLLARALRHGLQRDLERRMLRAVFTEGAAIDDHATLRRLAEEVGLDGGEVAAVLAGDAHRDDVEADLRAARDLDIMGVPAFVVGGGVLPGAQPPEVLLRLIERGVARLDAGAV